MSETTESMADRATNALTRTFDIYLEPLPGTVSKAGASGVHLYNFTSPVAVINGVFALGDRSDPAEVAAFAEEAAEFGVPWSIATRTAPSQEILEIAARHDLTERSTIPLLARDLTNVEDVLVDLPPEATVRRIDSAHGELYAEALAAGFEMPRAAAEVFAVPAALDHPAVDSFVLDVGGVAVVTGVNAYSGEDVGLYNGSGRPEYRRRGYYRALVSDRLRRAVARGARFAFTQNTPMSRPLYESLGFRVVEEWTYLSKSGN